MRQNLYKSNRFFGVLAGVIVIAVGVAMLLGIRIYWFIIPVAIGLMFAARHLFRSQKKPRD